MKVHATSCVRTPSDDVAQPENAAQHLCANPVGAALPQHSRRDPRKVSAGSETPAWGTRIVHRECSLCGTVRACTVHGRPPPGPPCTPPPCNGGLRSRPSTPHPALQVAGARRRHRGSGAAGAAAAVLVPPFSIRCHITTSYWC